MHLSFRGLRYDQSSASDPPPAVALWLLLLSSLLGTAWWRRKCREGTCTGNLPDHRPGDDERKSDAVLSDEVLSGGIVAWCYW